MEKRPLSLDGWSNELAEGTPAEVRAEHRFSHGHPFFPQPGERGAYIWRYFSFAKFVDFLSRRSLFFTRADLLGDKWEGATSRGSERLIQEAEEALARSGEPGVSPNWKENVREMLTAQRHSIFVSCWQMDAEDRPDMWERYCEGDYGVAIRTTYERLDAALPLHFNSHPVMLGLVSYGDYDSPDYAVDPSNLLAPFMSKRRQYRAEQEVRALFNCFYPEKENAPPGFAVRVKPDVLLQEVVISPRSPAWFESTVVRTCLQFRVDTDAIRVGRSRLDRDPFRL